jgi:hypothetical protein
VGTRRRGARYLGVALAVAAVLVAVAVVRSRGESTMAARVGETTISTQEVDLIVRHARDEARNEGKDFPREGTAAHQALRRQALSLLVYHEELAQRAQALGLEVPEADVAAPIEVDVGVGGFDSDAGADRVFIRQSVRGAALYRSIYTRVTGDVGVSAAEVRAYYKGRPEQYGDLGVSLAQARAQIRRNLVDTKRNALMARWIRDMNGYYAGKVEYGPEFRPA